MALHCPMVQTTDSRGRITKALLFKGLAISLIISPAFTVSRVGVMLRYMYKFIGM
jgi:hypothetical protein